MKPAGTSVHDVFHKALLCFRDGPNFCGQNVFGNVTSQIHGIL